MNLLLKNFRDELLYANIHPTILEIGYASEFEPNIIKNGLLFLNLKF